MRSTIIAIFFVLIAISCRDKVICPAFQSTYILDDSTRLAYYSYAWKLDDQTRQQYFASLPASADTNNSADDPMMRYYAYAEQIVSPAEQVRKTKFGIVKYEPYWLKNYNLRTAPKENVLGPGPLKKEEEVDIGEFVASDFADSLASDSVDLVTQKQQIQEGDSSLIVANDSTGSDTQILAKNDEKKEPKYLYRYDPSDDFNVEQEYYNKYFGERFIDNRPDTVPEVIDTDSTSTDEEQKGGFLGGLFGRKKSIESDSTAVDSEPLPVQEPTETPKEGTQNQETPVEGGGGGN